MEEVTDKVYEIAARIFNKNKESMELVSSPNTIEGWDSLTHAIFLSETEKAFSIKFDVLDMIHIQTIGDVVTKLQEKLK